jgi:hypothetical protein
VKLEVQFMEMEDMSEHQSQALSTRQIPFEKWFKRALRLNRDRDQLVYSGLRLNVYRTPKDVEFSCSELSFSAIEATWKYVY